MGALQMKGNAGPSLAYQLHIEKLIDTGVHSYVVGIDEVGRGSWAGPLCVGAVLYDLGSLMDFMFDQKGLHVTSKSGDVAYTRDDLTGLNDSKLLSPQARKRLLDPISALSRSTGLGYVEPGEIDLMGMAAALPLALKRAVRALGAIPRTTIMLIDGPVNFAPDHEVRTIIRGDSKSFAIACASILAKVGRDSLMEQEAEIYPWYCFESNKGYPSPAHLSALHAFGASQIHRRSWAFMDKLPWSGCSRSSNRSQPGLVL